MNALLENILKIPSASGECDLMQEFLMGWAEENGVEWTQDSIGNIYLTKGEFDTYPCAVAHMDTVHDIIEGGIHPIEIDGLVTGFNPKTMEQTGIGGDDKCGIYAALHCLINLEACKVAFFVDEEVGCLGSGHCLLEFFEDCRFILQADRRGHADWVEDISGPLGSLAFYKAVAPFLKKYDYKPVHGAMSDVMSLRDQRVGISVANMSAGYYNPHSREEFISIYALDRVCGMMLEICQNLNVVYPFTYTVPKRKSRKFSFSKFKSFDEFFETETSWMKQYLGHGGANEKELKFSDDQFEEYCINCHDVFPAPDMVQVGAGTFLCRDCDRNVYQGKSSML